MDHNKKSLYLGMLLSGMLILGFGILQQKESKLLKLPIQWIAVATLPTAIALFSEGYISKFKGFGVELESAINASISNTNTVTTTANDVLTEFDCDEKGNPQYLQTIPKERKQHIRRLSLVAGKVDFYNAMSLENYLRELPSLEYLEVKSKSDIICFIPINIFETTVEANYKTFNIERLERFIQSLEENNVIESFSEEAITLSVKDDQSLIDVLKEMRSENSDIAAVISKKDRYRGAVYVRDIEKRIADSVLISSQVNK